jgi:membrane protein DedA with SNARE-associated domain
VAGDLKTPVFLGFLAVVLVALIGAIVLYAIGKDGAAQVILPIGTGLLGLLTGQYLGESASKK